MNDNLERLLWQRKDGELAIEDRAELDTLLAEGASVAEHEIESMARLLSRARFEEEEVPAELRIRVMGQVQARTASRRRSQLLSNSNRDALVNGLSTLFDGFRKESFMSRKRLAVLGSIGVVVVAGVAFLMLSSDFPPSSKATGAIGGVEKAERYRDAQVEAGDVKLYDADGYDADGYDRNGIDRNGNHRVDDKAILGGGAIQDKNKAQLESQFGGGAIQDKNKAQLESQFGGGAIQDKNKAQLESQFGGGAIQDKNKAQLESQFGGGAIQDKNKAQLESQFGGGAINDKNKVQGGGSIAGGGAVQGGGAAQNKP